MLEIASIRQNPDLVKQKLKVRNFTQLELVDEILVLDDAVRTLKKKIEDVQMKINSRSDQIQTLIKNNQKEETVEIRDEVTLLKAALNKDKPELEQKTKSLEEKLIILPNLPHNSVPNGKAAEDNEIVREGGARPVLYPGAKAHWDLA